MGFPDIAFLPSQATFSSTCIKNCCRGEWLRITTCFRAVVGARQRYAPCKILLLQHSLYLYHLKFMEITRLPQS